MPLVKGKGRKIIGRNMGELVRSYKKSGKIGASRPSSLAKALAQAAAVSYDKAGEKKAKRI